METVYGHLEFVDTIAGGSANNIDAHGNITVEIQAITGATNEQASTTCPLDNRKGRITMSKIRVVQYINQFFAQIGGEEKADIPAELREGPVGPGLALNQAWGDEAEVVATVICGDSYFNENLEKAQAEVLEMVKSQNPDLFIAGPAFNAGRYGVACGTIAKAVQDNLNIPVLTGMYVENPGADMFKGDVYIVSTKNSAAGMRDAVKKMALWLSSWLNMSQSVLPARKVTFRTAFA